MTKREVLEATNFGSHVAEDEVEDLAAYFLKTDQFNKILSGLTDIVYGPKGSGKSAIYLYLLKSGVRSLPGNVRLVAAEKPLGTPAFSSLVEHPDATGQQLQYLWKLYFLVLVSSHFREWSVSGTPAEGVIDALKKAKLLPSEKSLNSYLRAVVDYVMPASVKGSMSVDPSTWTPTVTGEITFREPSAEAAAAGHMSVDKLWRRCNEALGENNLLVWLLLDRLDAAFAESEGLESRALRALFTVYLDLREHHQISLKIFLRSDIWKRVSAEGLREASHLVPRSTTIVWDQQGLLDLIVQRILRNESLRRFFGVSEPADVSGLYRQQTFFNRLFSPLRKQQAIDWILNLTSDGSGNTAPREVIHLLSSARSVQLRKLEQRHDETIGEALFSDAAVIEGLGAVSKARLDQTLYTEYPALKLWVEKLREEKTEQAPQELGRIWQMLPSQAVDVANRLVEVGFFNRKGSKQYPVFSVPPLYAAALGMVPVTGGD